MGPHSTPEDTTASPQHGGSQEAPSRGKKRKGILAHLPPVPKPVDVSVDGLTPRKAFFGWLIIVAAILIVGIGLNWAMTDGTWVPNGEERVSDPDAALGDTPVLFLTTAPYDLLTASLFTLSILILALSLVTPSPTGKSHGVFSPLAGAAGVLAALSLVATVVGPHLVDTFPRFAAFAEGTGLLIAAGVFAALAVAFLLIGQNRDALAARRHGIRIAGWLVFATHWALTGMYYYINGGRDWVNMAFAYAAVFLLAYFAYQELVSRSLKEDNPSLRFTAAAVVIAAGVWYAFLRVEFLSQFIIETVALHTVWMLEMFNQNVALGQDGRTGFESAISYPGLLQRRIVIIILACTAIQSMMIFVAAAFAAKEDGLGRMKVFQGPGAPAGTKTALFVLPSLLVLALGYWVLTGIEVSPVTHVIAAVFIALPAIALWGAWVSGKPLSLMQRRLLVVAVTVPLVYVLNLARNTGIIMMWADRWLETTMPGLVSFYANLSPEGASGAAFSIAHNWVGKGGSLIALVAIAFLVFKIMPEVLRALVGLLDLPRRRGPLEQYWRTLRGQEDTVAADATETA